MKRPLLSLLATTVLLSPAVTMLDSKAMAAASSNTVTSKQTEKSVKQRLLQERIQLLEKAIGSSITKKANGMSPTKRLAYLESILAPAVPVKAADIWAKGLKLRNGALQYAVLSPQLKKSRLSEFEKQNWVTGVSSPWIEAYQIIKTKKVNATTFSYDIRFALATSTGTAGSEDFKLTVQQYKKNWYVSQISLVTKNTVPAIKPLDEKSAALLAAQATIQYWYVASGGSGSGNEQPKTFTMNDLEYRYMSSDLDTKKEFTNYLRKTYTAEAIATYMKQAKIIEHNGRLAQPNADGGSLLQWNKAQATLIRYANGIAEYELKVPYGEEGAIEFDIRRIQLKHETDGWKVNTPPEERG